jgi:hypothetical protein
MDDVIWQRHSQVLADAKILNVQSVSLTESSPVEAEVEPGLLWCFT